MVLKDWKRYNFKNGSNELIVFESQNMEIKIEKDLKNNNWIVYIPEGKYGIYEFFKTKSQALKYARNYMRKH